MVDYFHNVSDGKGGRKLVPYTDAEKAEADRNVADAPGIAAATAYKLARESAYAPILEQLDMQYWDLVNGTTTWRDHVAKVKADYPKPALGVSDD